MRKLIFFCCLSLFLSANVYTANAAIITTSYLDVGTSIIVPDTVDAMTPFDVQVYGELLSGSSFSVFSYGLYRDASVTFDSNHMAQVVGGTLIDGSGFEFGNIFSESFEQILTAGTYTYSLVFGQRTTGHNWYDGLAEITVSVGQTPVPEPSTVILFAASLAGLIFLRGKKRC